VMAGLRAVIEQKGLFCSLYSDRGAHFWYTPKSGGRVAQVSWCASVHRNGCPRSLF